MKKKKLFGIFALTALLGLTLASCKKEEEPTPDGNDTPVTENNDYIDMTVSAKTKQLSSISVDTTNAKTNFYIGEKFTTDGLVVKANWVSYETGSPQALPSEEIKDYFIDSSKVDTTVMGSYPVNINYRVADKLVSATYNINVTSSYLDSLGIEYLAGITPDQTIFDFDLGGTYTKPKPTFTFHYLKSGVETDKTHEASTTEALYIITDDSAVDTNKKGSYMVKYKYTVKKQTVNGITIPAYDLVSYVIVNMNNPITSLAVKSGTTTYEQSIDDLDFSDWVITVTRKNGEAVDTPYSPELFTISGLNKYNVGSATATITSVENSEISTTAPVSIITSTTKNITVVNELKGLGEIKSDGSLDTSVVWNPLPFGSSANVEDYGNFKIASSANPKYKPGTFKITDKISVTNPSAAEVKRFNSTQYNDSLDGLNFTVRISVVGDSYFTVVMDAPGDIVVYHAASGDGDPRPVILYNSSSEVLDTKYNSGVKQEIAASKFTVAEAGTYTFKCPKGGYVHGIVTATNKA